MKIEDLHNLKTSVEGLPKAKGRQALINSIRKKIKFCTLFKVTEKEIEAMYNESEAMLHGLQSSAEAAASERRKIFRVHSKFTVRKPTA